MRIDGAGILDDLLTWAVEKLLRRRKPEGRLAFSIGVPGALKVTTVIFKDERTTIMAELSIDQPGVASITPLDRAGNPARLDGVPTWTISDPTLATITPSEDGLQCAVQAVGPLGKVTLSVSADADLGEGVETLSGSAEIDIVAGEAVALNLSIALAPQE